MLSLLPSNNVSVDMAVAGAINTRQKIIPPIPLDEYRYAVERPIPIPWNIGIKNAIGCPIEINPVKKRIIIKIIEEKNEDAKVINIDCSILLFINFCIIEPSWFTASSLFKPISIAPYIIPIIKITNKIIQLNIIRKKHLNIM